MNERMTELISKLDDETISDEETMELSDMLDKQVSIAYNSLLNSYSPN